MKHTPLEPNLLTPAAQKVLGPGPGKMMASKGMAPLAPADQVAVLYQLTLDGDHGIASAARETASKLPEKLLAGTLGAANIDARVLDFFAQIAGDKATVFDAIVMNTAIADDTVATLAHKAGPREIEIIAQNEQRLLRHPEIIGAMYMNKRARMSTVDRAVELAVRNQIRVPGLAAWDEIARALQANSGQPAAPEAETDALFSYITDALSGDDTAFIASGNPDEAPDENAEPLLELEPAANLPISKLSQPQKIRLATLGNAEARMVLVRDSSRVVAMAAIKAPGVTENEVAMYASNQTLSEDVIRYIANKREWTKMYAIRATLCRNPKCPIPDASRLMPLLRDKDLDKLSKSKNIPSALVAQARKLVMARKGGTDKKG